MGLVFAEICFVLMLQKQHRHDILSCAPSPEPRSPEPQHAGKSRSWGKSDIPDKHVAWPDLKCRPQGEGERTPVRVWAL